MEEYSTPKWNEIHFAIVQCKNLKSMGFGISKRCKATAPTRTVRKFLESPIQAQHSVRNSKTQNRNKPGKTMQKKKQDNTTMHWVSKPDTLRKLGRDQRKIQSRKLQYSIRTGYEEKQQSIYTRYRFEKGPVICQSYSTGKKLQEKFLKRNYVVCHIQKN